MQIRLVGPVQVGVDGTLVEVGPAQRCLVLAALAADAGRLVSREMLVDRVWGASPPGGAWRTVQTHIAHIRAVLTRAGAPPQAVRVRSRSGYLLDVDPDLVDVHRLRRLAVQAARGQEGDTERLMWWREAVGLWRGEPLATLDGDWVHRTRDVWWGEYREVVLGWADAETRAGDPTAVIRPLAELIVRYPLAEAVPAMLMRALYAVGRRAEALDCYGAARARLDEELAEQPGPELQAVYQAILRRDPALPAPASGGVVPAGTVVPAQLPADVRGFVGRADHLAALDAIADAIGNGAAKDGEATAVVISAIAGTAGVGKTALAVHWAHRAAKRFPDGQLYVNLHGFDPGGTVMDPADAIRGFLDALGIPAERIPADRDAQAGLYRTMLADKRMLIVLDNVRDSAQVRPLLPGAPGCLILVTSRNQLISLIAGTGAHPLPLGLLSRAEARDLLTRRIGTRRLNAELDAVDALITGCARLPLALALVAAHAATQPHLPLASLADDLHHTSTRLDALTDDDPTSDLRAVFSWSYRALSMPAARLFRLLGLHPGPDISAAAAASLADIAEADALLADLVRANLLVEHLPGRYAFHDLLRSYAAGLAYAHDSERDRHAALNRMLSHYTHTAQVADLLLRPNGTLLGLSLVPAVPGERPEKPADHQQAMAWFTAEHAVLLAALRQAPDIGFDAHTCELAWALDTFLDRQGHWLDRAAVGSAALHAARRLGNPEAEAVAHRFVAGTHIVLGHHTDAHIHLTHALHLYEQLGDVQGQALTHQNIATLWDRQDRPDYALEHAERALALYRHAGHRRGHADALNAVGWCYAREGQHREALIYCRQAITLLHDLDDRAGEAATWDSLGYAHHHLGEYDEAIACYQRSLSMTRALGALYDEADVLIHLGDTHRDTGNSTEAQAVWQQALDILQKLQHTDADEVRAKIEQLNQADL